MTTVRVVPAFDVAEDGEPRFDMRLERRKRIAGRSTASRASACSFQSSRPRRLRHGLQRSTLCPGTARKNLCALSSFVRYQRTIGALDRNPLELVTVPKKNPPRLRFESLETCQAIVDSQDEPYRAGGGAFVSNTRRTATATTT